MARKAKNRVQRMQKILMRETAKFVSKSTDKKIASELLLYHVSINPATNACLLSAQKCVLFVELNFQPRICSSLFS